MQIKSKGLLFGRDILVYMNTTRGYSLSELLVVIAIFGVLGVISVSTFLSWRTQSSVDSTATLVRSVLETARTQSVQTYEGNNYGVHLLTDRVVLFVGSSYSSNDASNTVTTLPLDVVITSPTSTSVVFSKFTGESSLVGDILLTSTRDASTTKRITIDQTGAFTIK